ncbi:MAG: hypothetical protein ABI691_13530 [Ginsengibacter sp.]
MFRKISRLLMLVFLFGIAQHCFAQNEKLSYHEIKTDAAGKIIPWYSPGTGKAYSNAIQSVWHFWDTMRIDLNGLPYYMNHQVWRPGINDPRGIAGSQFTMAMESWRLLYAYTGDERLKDNIKFMADYNIANGFSSATSQWPNLPYPYNTLLYTGKYDGDMVLGKNYLQPDKAGSFGMELVQLYKLIGRNSYQNVVGNQYLDIAVDIANTLAAKMIDGDADNSPLPFKVNTVTGEIGKIYSKNGGVGLSSYTSNWSGTMSLYLELIKLNKGNAALYQKAFDRILVWMKKYPLINNKWGPFFEDISVWSDTQINAITFAQFMMNHPEYFPEWKQQVKGIFGWVYSKMKNDRWKKYGVTVINEQTAFQIPGNSHTARQAAAELQYVTLSGDTSFKENAIRQLNWATYMVNTNGRNRYPQDDIWLTDGYGDYVRHYLVAMAALPSLAVCDEEHILSSTSVIQQADYKNNINKGFEPGFEKKTATQTSLFYGTYDAAGKEVIFLLQKPSKVLLGKKVSLEVSEDTLQGFQWKKAATGGFLIINRTNAKEVSIVQ